MPIYQATKTYRGGFYNNDPQGTGVNDRVYSALDIRKPYDVIYTDGVKPDADGTAGDNLKVSLFGGMQISVGAGFAKLGGAWFENTATYNITLDAAGSAVRYDCVILRNDDSEAVREPNIYIKSLAHIPTINDLQRDDLVYEVCLAYVKVNALASSLVASDIIDTRTDGELCNVMSGVGATVIRTYNNTVYSTSVGQTNIAIGIPEYDRTRDTLIVAVEGRTFAQGVNYTIKNNSTITLALGLPVTGTRIDFQVLKNVNAAGASTVVQEVGVLRTETNAVNKKLEHHYYCNGLTDNINLSNLAQDWLKGDNYDSATVYVHGHFEMSGAYSGSGTTSSPAVWFALGKASATKRKITFDFSDCGEIRLSASANSYNIIFDGHNVNVVGASVIANGGTSIKMFSAVGSAIPYARDCYFEVTADREGTIAKGGRFDNCFASVTLQSAGAACFEPNSASVLRVNGGEYYAYTGNTSAIAAVVRIVPEATEVVALTNAINCPTVAKTGFRQTHAVLDYSANGCCVYADTITLLDIQAASQVTRNTIELSKPNMR